VGAPVRVQGPVRRWCNSQGAMYYLRSVAVLGYIPEGNYGLPAQISGGSSRSASQSKMRSVGVCVRGELVTFGRVLPVRAEGCQVSKTHYPSVRLLSWTWRVEKSALKEVAQRKETLCHVPPLQKTKASARSPLVRMPRFGSESERRKKS
jgi:hypothetical protein